MPKAPESNDGSAGHSGAPAGGFRRDGDRRDARQPYRHSSAPWAAGTVAVLGLGLAGVAYDRAARGEAEGATVVLPSGAHGLSFAPALIGLGIVIGVSIAAETAALLWSTLLLRAEAPKLAAIAGLGAAFFAGCQATLRVNADVIRLRISDQRNHRRIVRGRCRGIRGRRGGGRVRPERRRLRPHRDWHRCDRALQLRPRRAPVRRPAGRRPVFGIALQRADASAGAARDRRDRAKLFPAGRLCRLRARPRAGGCRDGRLRAARTEIETRGKVIGLGLPAGRSSRKRRRPGREPGRCAGNR